MTIFSCFSETLIVVATIFIKKKVEGNHLLLFHPLRGLQWSSDIISFLFLFHPPKADFDGVLNVDAFLLLFHPPKADFFT